MLTNGYTLKAQQVNSNVCLWNVLELGLSSIDYR